MIWRNSMVELEKIKVILIAENKNMNIATFPIKENKVLIEKDNYEPFFTADSVFGMKEISTIPLLGRWINRHRKREPCIIQLLGKERAETLKTITDELFEPLTNEERKDIVKREIAKTLRKFGPISNWMFAVLLILLIVNVILAIMNLQGVKIG